MERLIIIFYFHMHFLQPVELAYSAFQTPVSLPFRDFQFILSSITTLVTSNIITIVRLHIKGYNFLMITN